MTTAEKSTKRSCVEKMAVAAGSLAAVGALGAEAEAGVVTVTGSPVTLSLSDATGTIATWDVDGANGADFQLAKGFSSIYFQSFGLNGRGLVGPTYVTDNVQALNQSFSVGPTLANGLVWGFQQYGGTYSVASYAGRNAMSFNSGIGYDFNFGFNDGDNFIGFRFEVGGAFHYGFANINFDTTNGIVSITEWAYNDEPRQPIHVEDIQAVPEPSSLALLAMGAGGLLAYRARKKNLLSDSKEGAA